MVRPLARSSIMTRRLPEECRSGEGYGAVGRVAVVLWVVCFSAIVVVAAGSVLGSAGGVVGADERGAADGATVRGGELDHAEGIVERYFPGVDVSFDFGEGTGLDVGVSTRFVGVRLAGLGGDDGRQTGTISHGAIDEGVSRSSNAGLCAIGLTGEDAPVSLDVDAEDGSVRADLSSEPSERRGANAGQSAAETVSSCRTGPAGAE